MVESTCQGCSVGCRIVIDGSRNEVLRYMGVDSDPVNWSWLCDKGRFGFETVGSPERLGAPLVKGADGTLGETRWADALTQAARAIKAGLDKSGPSGTAVIGGARLTNESAYAWAKLAKGVIGTDHVDAQLGDGLPADVVASLPRATIDEACAAGGTLLVIGSDPKDELAGPVPAHPRRRHPPRRHRGGAGAPDHLAHRDRRPLAALHARRGQRARRPDHRRRRRPRSGARRCSATSTLTVLLGRGSLAEAPGATVAAAASLLAAFPNVRFLSGLRRANVHGALDLGLTPGLLPGRVTLDEGRDWFADAWGSVPAETGLDTAGILAAAADGRIDTLILLGADPLADFPDRELAARGLAGARTVIAVETLLNSSTAEADVVLPAAGPAEVDGTTTNLEGRVSTVRQKVTPPGHRPARLDDRRRAGLPPRRGPRASPRRSRCGPRSSACRRPTPGSPWTPSTTRPTACSSGRSTPEAADDGGATDADSTNAPDPEASDESVAAAASDTDAEAQAHEAAAVEAEAADAAADDGRERANLPNRPRAARPVRPRSASRRRASRPRRSTPTRCAWSPPVASTTGARSSPTPRRWPAWPSPGCWWPTRPTSTGSAWPPATRSR